MGAKDRQKKRANRAHIVLDHLLAHAPALFAQTVGAPRRCILATRFGYDVFRMCGIKTEPIPVNVRALNAVAIRLSEEGCTSVEEALAAGAWEVAVDTTVGGDGYPGHLILHVPDLGVCVDLDAQQFARPEKLLLVPDALELTATPLFLRGKQVRFIGLDAGGQILYMRLTDPPVDYRDTPDWKTPKEDMVDYAKLFVERFGLTERA